MFAYHTIMHFTLLLFLSLVENGNILLQMTTLVLGRKPPHTFRADHDLGQFVHAQKHVFLDVRNAMLGTNGADRRCGLLVREHAQVGPH